MNKATEWPYETPYTKEEQEYDPKSLQPPTPRPTPPCGNSDCSCSTGIHESSDDDGSPEKPWALTFGRGDLYDMGYWEIPCAICARAMEISMNVPVGSYWPFPEKK